MKFSLSWLKTYLDTDASLETIVEKLTALGLEVEDVSNPAELLKDFYIAHVVEAVQHPNADKLRLCKVDTGKEMVQVVCGAPNARTGLKGVFAASGTYVPGVDFTLRPTEIRGVESNGMLCSERELMLSDEHDGIIDLPEDAPVGVSFVDYMKLDDPVIEIAITPNRQDCLGVYGIARDLAAAGVGTLKALDVPEIAGSFDSPVSVSLNFDEASTNACPMFVGRYIRGVKNGPSPKWLQDRLKAIGQKSISALVDITNYISYDLGRPLHVYDADKLNGNVQARLATTGETFTALDDKDYEATAEDCVIADDKGVLGFGGVIGGADSGCGDETQNVFLEVAYFDPIRTAMTGRTHQILTDARYRFERGVDRGFLPTANLIASQMILDLCGGEASAMVVAGAEPAWQKTVDYRPSRSETLGGLALPVDQQMDILAKLGFEVVEQGDDLLKLSVPSWRSDVDGEADIVEEVLRIHGYDNIPVTFLERTDSVAHPTLTLLQKRARAARRQLAVSGLNECVTWSFIPEEQAKAFGWSDHMLKLDNPISVDMAVMRPSLLPNLLAAVKKNADRGQKTIALFEIGNQFENDTPKGQTLVAAGVRAGQKGERHWQGGAEAVTVFDAKRDVMAALAEAGAPVENLQVFTESSNAYHPGRSGTLRLGPKNIIAYFGELHPGLLAQLDVKGPVVGFEILLENIPAPRGKGGKTKAALAVTDLQAVERDFAFLVKKDVEAQNLLRAIKGADKKHITRVGLFDVFEGKGMEADEKSLAVTVRMEPSEQTFTEEALDAISAKVIAAAEKAVSAKLRS